MRQKGVALVITLIALVAMTLAAIALVRSVDTGNVVAGNLAFKQGAALSGDMGTESAITWLGAGVAGVAASQNDIPSSGYYSTSQEGLDMTGNRNDPGLALVDWDGNNCNNAVAGGTATACIEPAPLIPANPAGYEARYIIHRLCPSSGLANNCASTASTVAGTSSGALDYTGKGGLSGETEVEYYRITTRVRGPRNTISFVETIIHF
jgi:Tfp pilus assembly protein PilX